MGKYKNIILPTVVLTVISVLVAMLLAVTYKITGIGELGTGLTEEELAEYAPLVLSEGTTLSLYEYETEGDLLGVYVSDTKDAVALHITATGYAGKSKPIEALIGIDKDGVIQGITIVECQETPGVGSKIQNKDYLKNYQGISGSADDVDTITSATISSKALRNGVNFALQVFEELKGEVFA